MKYLTWLSHKVKKKKGKQLTWLSNKISIWWSRNYRNSCTWTFYSLNCNLQALSHCFPSWIEDWVYWKSTGPKLNEWRYQWRYPIQIIHQPLVKCSTDWATGAPLIDWPWASTLCLFLPWSVSPWTFSQRRLSFLLLLEPSCLLAVK